MKEETVVITGGISGIGYELAKLFANDGYHLIIIAQNKEKLSEIKKTLENTYNVHVYGIQKDLAKRESALEIFEFLKKENINIDVLVNNAGFGQYGAFTESDWHEEEQMMNLNMFTLTHLTKLVLPQMIRRKKGKILNLSSTAAFQPGPLMAIYYATKAYVLSFSLALAEELQGTGVTVTTLCPGPTRTGFQERANMQRVRLFSRNVMDASAVARAGYKGLREGKKLVIPGARNLVLAKAVSLVSPSFAARVVKRMQEEQK